jgi:helix-hairpin-helix protein
VDNLKSQSSKLNNRIFISLYFLFFAKFLLAQTDTIPLVDPSIDPDIIENFIEDTGEETPFDFNTAFEDMQTFSKKKLDLNKATAEDLGELAVLNDLQIQNLLKYRSELGNLISIYELQAVPGFDLETIYKILPFVDTKSGLDDIQLSILEMLAKSRNEVYMRWGKILEQQRGYIIPDDINATRYLGDPNRLYFRYLKNFENKMSLGFTAEKDPGEEFFKGSNKQGFDYYSAHFFLKDYNSFLKTIAIGDYTASFGQGLILYSGFGRGKSAEVLNIKRNRRAIKKYTSVNETNFLRGAAATLAIAKNIEFTALFSYRKLDANIPDSNINDPEIEFFTSLQTSGNHRTAAEIKDEGAIKSSNFGGSLQYKKNGFNLGFNGLYTQFNRTFERNTIPYNQFYFNGNSIVNLSTDYSWVYKNLNFFGETAWSNNGAIATTNGLIAALDRNIHISLLHRYFPVDYQALDPNPMAETTGARNENGMYMGLEIKPSYQWTFQGYFDIYKHPWLRSNADSPSNGYELRGKLIYKIKRKLTAYVEVRNEIKWINTPENETKIDFLSESQLFQTKLHVAYDATKALEVRNRIHFGYFKTEGFERFNGIMIYQDILYKPIGFPISFTARYAIFDTDSYNIRFYTFENNLLYTQSIPALSGKGTRYYLNLRYRGIRNLTIEARIAQTRYTDRKTVGSGLEEIIGNKRTEVSAQIKYKF